MLIDSPSVSKWISFKFFIHILKNTMIRRNKIYFREGEFGLVWLHKKFKYFIGNYFLVDFLSGRIFLEEECCWRANPNCVQCRENLKVEDHLFCRCGFVEKTCYLIFKWIDMKVILPTKGLMFIWHVSIWKIWKVRDQLFFLQKTWGGWNSLLVFLIKYYLYFLFFWNNYVSLFINFVRSAAT